MDKTALIAEVQEFISLPIPLSNKRAYFLDLQKLYKKCTGRNCRTEYKMRGYLELFVKQNQNRLETLNNTVIMAATKYQFSKAAINNGVTQIVLQNPTELVTPENLTDAQAERILGIKSFAHNIELKPSAAKAEAEQEEPKTARKSAKKDTDNE